jgi:hypothetical protein
MHARIAADTNYLRIDPVSSREQYRWMERFIPMVDEPELRGKLTQAIDGKGAFRRFKDVLMTYAADRERWFTFRSERLRTFMEAWLSAHAIKPIARPADGPESRSKCRPKAPHHFSRAQCDRCKRAKDRMSSGRRTRNAEALRTHLGSLATRSARAISVLVAFASFETDAQRAASSPRTPAPERRATAPVSGNPGDPGDKN